MPCCALATQTISAAAAERVAPIFKALGDPVRLRLTSMIAAQSEVCVNDLTGVFALSGPTISHHLKVLREAGLIEGERRGTWVYYRVRSSVLTQLSELLGPLPAPARTP